MVPVKAGETPAWTGKGSLRTGGCWEWPRKQTEGQRRRNLLRSHMCFSRARQGVGDPG